MMVLVLTMVFTDQVEITCAFVLLLQVIFEARDAIIMACMNDMSITLTKW